MLATPQEGSASCKPPVAYVRRLLASSALMLSGVFCVCPLSIAQPEEPAGKAIDLVLARFDADAHSDLRAVVVLQSGRPVAQRYFNGATPTELHDIRSAGKSVTSLLVGAAIAQGRIASVSDAMEVYFKAARGKPIGKVRIEDLLTMRSGLAASDEDPDSAGNEDKLDAADDPVAFALSVPMATNPGSSYAYNSLTAYLTGLVVEAAVGERLDTFASKALFEPIGISNFRWRRDLAGHSTGQGNLSITAADFARIGQLVLDHGRWDGKQVIPGEWIDASLKPRVPIAHADPYADHYGYLWYEKTHRIGDESIQVFFASGNGGNKIYIVPSKQLAVAITSKAYGRGYGQRRSQQVLLGILEAMHHLN